MISKFLILFFTIFSNVFTGIVITDQNGNNKFDIMKIEAIGKIKVDDSFVDYVLDINCSSCFCKRNIFVGTYLQTQCLYYMLRKINSMNAKKEGSYIQYLGAYIQYLNSLIHIQEVYNPEEIMTVEKILDYIDLNTPTLVPGECLSAL